MSKKSIGIFIVIALVVIVGIVLAAGSGNSSNSRPQGQYGRPPMGGDAGSVPAPVSSATSSDNASRMKMYGMTEVAMHNSASSCWSAINGSVYDLTSWIGKHPGGQQAILSICGKDGSAAFNDQHDGQRRPANELAGFKIGLLGQ